MPAYLISYDLVKPDHNYAALTAAIKSAPDWLHLQDSVWVVIHAGPETVIRNALLPYVQAQDRLFVNLISNTWAGSGMPVATKWLNDRGY